MSAPPSPARGRRPERELAALRGRIEALLLQGLRPPAIHRALTGPESPSPVALSPRQVRDHVRAVERGWAERAGRDALDADRARAAAVAEELYRTAMARSTRSAASNVGVGYLNVAVKAQDQWIRLRGLDAPARTELTGPGGSPLAVALADHPADHLGPREEARRLRRLADDAEARAAEADDGAGAGA